MTSDAMARRDYRRKGSIVSAVQWDGVTFDGQIKPHRKLDGEFYRETGYGVVTPSLGGLEKVVRKGEWVVFRPDGFVEVWSDAEFRFNYEVLT